MASTENEAKEDYVEILIRSNYEIIMDFREEQ